MQAAALIDSLAQENFAEFSGKVVSIGQKSFRADGPFCKVGSICEVGSKDRPCLSEVVAVGREHIDLVPLNDMREVAPEQKVTLSNRYAGFRVGDEFAGRAINAFGEPIDGEKAIVPATNTTRSDTASMSKTVVTKRVETGVRAIDALLPIAQGQRIGVFAASGVGKTTLVEQLSTQIECDKVVVCLIGERGREVERLWRLHQEQDGGPPLTLVAATSDESPSLRVRAMSQAMALCEYWRAQGQHIVFFVDSATRLAMALRDIGLAAGEPPALRSYTPNVFAALSAFVERCGSITGSGSITALFTVLSETDDVDDPIVETMKSLLDGHIILSRKLAERGHYPAIDVRASISRLADELLDDSQHALAGKLKATLAIYDNAKAMIESGLYQQGSNTDIDQAVAILPKITQFLQQSNRSHSSIKEGDDALRACLAGEALA